MLSLNVNFTEHQSVRLMIGEIEQLLRRHLSRLFCEVLVKKTLTYIITKLTRIQFLENNPRTVILGHRFLDQRPKVVVNVSRQTTY